MRQILSNLKTGVIRLEEVPAPTIEAGHVLIATLRSLVSQGTERMLVEFGRASLFQKARAQPDRVKQVLGKMCTEGVRPTLEAVFRRLDEPLPLGYCSAGVVVGVGEGVSGFAIGDRVAANGPHAEVVSVPANLVAKVPDNVSDDAAAFTVVGAIGLQGIRLARPELGETFVVIGLGLIGQVTAQLLRAAGCRVAGLDFDGAKVETARRFGIEGFVSNASDPVRWVEAMTGGLGADAVIITASTASHEVIAQAARMSRKRGRIVLIGVVGLNLDRADFYAKELTFQVSCSYGPGRYDDAYEEKGLDYPVAFVRWTENRNFQAVLQAMSAGTLNVEPLVTRRVALAQFRDIYDDLGAAGLASLFTYGAAPTREGVPAPPAAAPPVAEIGGDRFATLVKLYDTLFTSRDGALAIVGAGNFAKATALPALAGAAIKTIVSSSGVTGTMLAKKYGVPFSGTDYAAVLVDPDVRGVIIMTRHNLHARQAVAALQAGKHVLVEKPLCLALAELRALEAAVASAGSTSNPSTITVGYNRRFAPHVEKMKELLGGAGPISFVATMNAGAIPAQHWTHDPEVGGGRIVGEACHYVDLAIFLVGHPVIEVSATQLVGAADCASILLQHRDGSVSVINYLANGHRDVSKERIEVHSQGRTLVLDNFRELRGHGFPSFSKMTSRQNKGHAKQFALFAKAVKTNGPALIPWDQIVNSTAATLAIPLAIREKRWVRVEELK